jgi:5-methylcytosine-specific restriction protein A
MALSDITREGVIAALNEYDQKGRDIFLSEYGFSPARRYVLVNGQNRYDSKAICGVAHKFDLPSDGVLRAEDFSGGIRTVVRKLQALGFTILDELPKLEIKDENGRKVQATCEVSHDKGGWAATLHSRGGTKGTNTERNPGYRQGLETLLSRLVLNRAIITEVLLDSDPSHKLKIGERRLVASVPMQLTPSTDVPSLARQIVEAAASIRGVGVTKPGGNPTKQVRIVFTLDTVSSLSQIESLLIEGKSSDRPVFVLTWNPIETVIDDEAIAELARTTKSGQSSAQRWSTGNRNGGINPDDYVIRFRQINNRGIVALGRATSYVYEDVHWVDETKLANYVDVAWEQVLRTEDRLAIEEIELLTYETHWDAMLGSGVMLTEGDSQIVVEAWKLWYAQVAGAQSSLSGEEAGATSASPSGVIEGAVTTVLVNRYERSATARRKCIEHYGAICAVCSLDFKSTYGQIGEGFIHVHHIVPISSIGETYVLDPITDLVPVCPNCHAMLHRGIDVPRGVLELQQMMNGE